MYIIGKCPPPQDNNGTPEPTTQIIENILDSLHLRYVLSLYLEREPQPAAMQCNGAEWANNQRDEANRRVRCD